MAVGAARARRWAPNLKGVHCGTRYKRQCGALGPGQPARRSSSPGWWRQGHPAGPHATRTGRQHHRPVPWSPQCAWLAGGRLSPKPPAPDGRSASASCNSTLEDCWQPACKRNGCSLRELIWHCMGAHVVLSRCSPCCSQHCSQHIETSAGRTSAWPCPLRPVGRHFFLPATLQPLCPPPISLGIPATLYQVRTGSGAAPRGSQRAPSFCSPSVAYSAPGSAVERGVGLRFRAAPRGRAAPASAAATQVPPPSAQNPVAFPGVTAAPLAAGW